ncbi:uncharacterized protein BX663DRAFT_514624 [Cokeromyces recurvatus]|uniref:uncharacterized protein n=1 Tax=Cokeromyces recurvatus TaxID=90255 RepID=UPI0022211A40|nr:uncharacterized protein BX663DRAFT_514624 [Cokeromyces recurvatus]KAI7901495.1 hypothetical protein BX663DRAFT_514624 [Cokeromyces recurvatus]
MLPIQDYLVDWHVRVTWIAFMTLWVLWGLAWFSRHAFGGDASTHYQNANYSTQVGHDPNVTTTTDPELGGVGVGANTTTAQGTTAGYNNTAHKQPLSAPAWSVNIFNRLNRAHDMLRDLVLMLLSVLTLNTFARASTRAVMIIAWIFLAFAVIYFVVEASYEHRYLRLLYALTFYGLGLAVVGLAYAQGFYY